MLMWQSVEGFMQGIG